MKVILFGATGMVGSGVLRQCLLAPEVESVLAIGRTASGVKHDKLRDLVRPDMFDAEVPTSELAGYDACLFCLGVSSVGKSEAEYTRLTYDLTMAWARVLARANPAMRLLYVSGMGTGGSSMWARVKGRTETDLQALLPQSIMIRLAALRPTHGERSRTPGGNVLLALMTPLWPLLQWSWPNGVITTEELGRAMIRAARDGGPTHVLESADLIALGRQTKPAPTGVRVAVWLAQILLGLTFIGAGMWKLVTPISELAAKMPWIGQKSPGFLYMTAVLDLACGIGVLLPSLTRIKPGLAVLAAFGSVVFMIGAVVFHVSRGEASSTPLNFLLIALAVFVAWGRGAKAPLAARASR
jgi:uncharacterized protein YbjT (DUF2867 family)